MVHYQGSHECQLDARLLGHLIAEVCVVVTVDIVPRATNWVYLHVREGEREGLHSEVQYDVSCSARPQKCCYAQRSIRSWFSSVQAQANGQVMEGSEVLQGMEVGMRG